MVNKLKGPRPVNELFLARDGQHTLGARAGKYKLGARAGKYKLGVGAGGQAKGWWPGNTNTLFIQMKSSYLHIFISLDSLKRDKQVWQAMEIDYF